MNQNNIGEFILLSRKEKGLTQKQLADIINVSDKTISKWENGISTPDTTILSELCVALGISVNELISAKKLPPEEYTLKAEENIMNLLQENNEKSKLPYVQYIVGAVLLTSALLLMFNILQTSFLFYLDVFSLIFPALICLGVLLLCGKRSKKERVAILRKTVIPSGIIVTVVSLIALMGHLDDFSTIGPNLAVCLLTMLYCAVAYVVLVVIEVNLDLM